MNIIVISLEKAPERRTRIIEQLDNLGLDHIIMNAVDGSLLSEGEKNKFIKILNDLKNVGGTSANRISIFLELMTSEGIK